ncbi:MAG: hypothetical protein WD768_01580 [Phycisphaeraceae bacterium]
MSQPILKIRHPRPAHLSDPYCDFTPEELRTLLNTPDERLAWNDLASLLGNLAAGTYDETVYFLPLALDFLRSDKEGVRDLIDPVVCFLSRHAELLRSEGLLAPAIVKLHECFESWTHQFEFFQVEHSKRSYVVHGGDVYAVIEQLVRWMTHESLTVEWARELSDHGNVPAKAAWFLHLASEQKQGAGVYGFRDFAALRDILTDERRLRSAGGVVIETRMVSDQPEFWENVFLWLGL